MKRIWMLIAMLTVALGVGCGGDDKKTTGGSSANGGGDEGADYEDDEGLDDLGGGKYTADKGTATVTGKVSWEGDVPEMKLVDTGNEEFCESANEGDPLRRETTIVGADGGLANVFVTIKSGLTGWKFDVPSEGKVLDQQACRYVPHMIGLQAKQPLVIRNSDPIMHNVQAFDENGTTIFNFGQSKPGEDRRDFRKPGYYDMKCQVHSWMNATVCVVRHPFYAVTDKDGAFTLAKLPPGTYTIEAFHPKHGKKTANVTVGDGESKSVSFSYSKS